jgi:hypothetical protein
VIMGASESKVCKALASLPLTQRIHLVREIASRGYKDAVDMSACRALVKTYPHHHLKEPIVSRAARQVLRSLIERILIISESALGPIKKQSDRHARVAIFLLLDTEVDNGVAICGEVRSLKLARQAWVAAESDWRRGLLNHYRNRFVAHRAEPDHDKRVPFVDELETISGRVVFMLAQLATGAGIQVDNREVQSDTNYLSASAFWKPWQSAIRS